MKHTKQTAVSLLMALILMLSLAACGGGDTSAAGTYKLTSMDLEGMSMDIKQLEELSGVKMNITLELKKNGDFTLDMAALDESDSLSGTWKADGNNLTLTSDGEDVTGTLDGKTLVLKQGSESLTFEKK